MPIIARDKPSDFLPAPEGLHAAVCCDVVDLGMVETEWQGKKTIKHKIELRWQIEETVPEGKPGAGHPFLIVSRYTNSLHENSALRPLLESWRGRAFTDEELKGFDLEHLIGVPCQLQVIHNVTPRGTYANVTAVVKLGKGMTPLYPRDYVRVCERPDYQPPVMPEENAPPEDASVPFPEEGEVPF